jgi:hypothetical protein
MSDTNERAIRLRIISDGTVNGTTICDADTGASINGYVAEAKWSAKAGERDATATLVVRDVELVYVGAIRLVDATASALTHTEG